MKRNPIRKLPLACAASLVLVLHALPSWAQSVVGRSMVDGRAVELRDDGTWIFTEDAPATEAGCRDLGNDIAFCGDGAQWQPTPPPNRDIVAQYRYDDRHYSQFVIEAVGVEDGLTAEYMRNAVLQIASSITGIPVADIPVFGMEPVEVDGRPGETILYQVDVDGLSVVYSNTIVTLPRRTLQAMSFTLADSYTDSLGEVHKAFLSNIRISGGQE